jgi:hypothetical protein
MFVCVSTKMQLFRQAAKRFTQEFTVSKATKRENQTTDHSVDLNSKTDIKKHYYRWILMVSITSTGK